MGKIRNTLGAIVLAAAGFALGESLNYKGDQIDRLDREIELDKRL